MTNDNTNLPPLNEVRLSAQIRDALDGLERLGHGICKIVIDLENIHSELLLRKLKREGKPFAADEFGKKE